jgi:DNA repair exonuclease SbcCD nuclease subunit
MIKFIHTADIHLDSPLHRLEAYEGAPVEEIRQASRRAFENLIELAIAENVDFVLIAGDLFDGDWKDYNTGLYFIKQVHRLKKADIDVFIVSGNHDAAGRMTRALSYPENVHVFSHKKPETQTIETLKVAIHGQSFSTPAVTDNMALSYPDPVPGYFNIGLLHTSLNGREGHENYAPCTVEDLKNRGYDFWALGHIHQSEIISSDPFIVFPGCIQGRHVRETGRKGGMLVTVTGGAVPEVVHTPFDVIRWEQLEVNLNGAETPQTCLDRFKEVLETLISRHDPLPVIVRVTFTGDTDAHTQLVGDLEYWKELVRSTAVANFGERSWVEKVYVHTRPKSSEGQKTVDPGPLLELERLVTDIKADEDSLLMLGSELSTLFRKLPAEYRQSEGALNPEDPGRLSQIVDQAHALIAQGLKKEAPDS